MKRPPITKYKPFPPVSLPDRQWPDRAIQAPPVWCSVDLRDGNQALAIPMSVTEKLEMFEMLTRIGFKQIEVGFPSASETEFEFTRRLIEEDRIPEDVTIQVLVQAREHLIRRTFESLRGARKAIVHLYNSTSPVQRKITFNLDKAAIKDIAVRGTELVRSLLPELPETEITFQYSPESFSDTEVEYSLEVCEAVMDAWGASPKNPIILNLPATVEVATPNVHADQIEWFCRNLRQRDAAVVSLHTHNDQGCGIAATMLGLMAGADRVEGTLFGNGERTGNLDIVTVALNLYTQGIGPGLDFGNLPEIVQVYERLTRMEVPPRLPYAGELVFTAFSGSHQDAIKKGMDARRKRQEEEEEPLWEVPYLLIDPADIGRNYKAIIRINSQSGKGGVAFVLSSEYGFDLPKPMHMEVGQHVNDVADRQQKELSVTEIHEVFKTEFLNRIEPLELLNEDVDRIPGEKESNRYRCLAQVRYEGEERTIEGSGNGPINAFVHAMEREGWKDFHLVDFRQHALGGGSATDSAAYVQLQHKDGRAAYGCGTHSNIETAGLKALICAYNRLR